MPESAVPPPSAVEAATRIRAVVGRFRRRLHAASADDDLTMGQQSVLARLSDHHGATVSDLAAAEGMRHQSMTATVGPLLASGLVQREPDPADGRRQRLVLSAEGRTRLAQDRAARGEWLTGRLEDVCTEEERRTVIAAMAVLERIIDE